MFIVLSSSLTRWDVFVLRKRLAACLAGVLRQLDYQNYVLRLPRNIFSEYTRFEKLPLLSQIWQTSAEKDLLTEGKIFLL